MCHVSTACSVFIATDTDSLTNDSELRGRLTRLVLVAELESVASLLERACMEALVARSGHCFRDAHSLALVLCDDHVDE